MKFKSLPFFAHVNWSPTASDLRKFAFTMLVGFTLIGVFFAWRRGGIRQPALTFWTIGVTLAIAAMLPGIGRFAYLAVYVATGVIGYVVSRVLLTVVFFAIFTPLALILRLTGKDLLRLRRDSATAWIAHPATSDRRSYYRQF